MVDYVRQLVIVTSAKESVIGLHLYEIPTELSSLMNLSVTTNNGPIMALNFSILTTLRTKNIAILSLDKN